MRPTPINVILWVFYILVAFALICAWGVREDDRRRHARALVRLRVKSIGDALEEFRRNVEQIGVAVRDASTSMMEFGRALLAAGSQLSDQVDALMQSHARAIERRARETHPPACSGGYQGEGHIQFTRPDGRAVDFEFGGFEMRGVTYDDDPITRGLEPGSFAVEGDTLFLDITPNYETGWYTQRPEENWSDAHRVAAIADQELAAWREFIDGCNR